VLDFIISLRSNKIGMPLHDKAFYSVSFFLIGVLLASFINDWQQKILVTVLVTVLVAMVFLIMRLYALSTLSVVEGLPYKSFWLAILSLGILLGAGYYFVFDAEQKDFNIHFGDKITFTGIIQKVSTGLNQQNLVLGLQDPYQGRIRITAPRYPSWSYGDLVEVQGTIKKPSEQSEKYFEKEGIFGTASFPEIAFMESGRGSPIKSLLFKIKGFAEATFKRVLSPEKAAFMSGLTLGETAEFSKEFREKMSLTGTSHLVALSGYNITIIGKGVMLALGLWFSRRKIFLLSTLTIILFVIMTGAEASVVRAAIMGFIVLLANQVQRLYSFRNAIAIAAFLMILFNPKILVWDIGFQLSFAAVMGLVYLEPAIRKLFKVSPKPGFLNWRANLLTTVSAQLAVIPILLSNFSSFSLIGFLTNILVLTFVPATMFLGLLVVAAGILSYYLAQVIGWLANIFLSYEIGVIDLFAKIPIQISVQSFSLIFSVLYYVIIITVILYARRRKAHVLA